MGGPYDTRAEAEKREREVQYFKHKANLNLTDPPKWLIGFPPEAIAIGVEAFEMAVSRNDGTPNLTITEDEARQIALSAIENKFRKVGDAWIPKADLCNVEMIITKANLQPDGTMRWQAVTSDTSPDNLKDMTTLSLFQDWIERIEDKIRTEWLPPPRKPFIGLSHYSDLGGLGEAGLTEAAYIDSNRFKAKGTFYTDKSHPLGKALFNALRREGDLIQRGNTIAKPIRISAAWWDISHSHGDFIFTRKSLLDVCPMCEQGAGDKVFLKGQLDHFAATRVPINPRTSIALQERAMTITKREDAISIIEDEELVDEIDKLEKAQLTGKSETILVTKAKTVKPKDEEEDDKTSTRDEPMEEDVEGETGKKAPPFAKKHRSLITLSEALEQSPSRFDALRMVEESALELPESEQLGVLKNAIAELGNELIAVRSAAGDLYLIESLSRPLGEKMTTYEQFLETVQNTLQGEGTKDQKAAVLQEALNNVASALKTDLEGTPSEQPNGDIAQAIKAALTPLTEQISMLNARLAVPAIQPAYQAYPVQRSLSAPVVNQQPQQPSLPISPITQQPSQLTAQIRRGMGLH